MKSILFVLVLLVLLPSMALGQATLRGRVIDQQTQQPLAGVNVVVPGSSTGTTTDAEGNFALATTARRLHVSFVGYINQTVAVADPSAVLNILMNPDNVLLNEIQVMGYDTNRRLQETAGAVAVVTEKDLNRTNRISLLPVLNTIPGVRMDQSDLANARISIRGNGVRSNFGIRNIKIYVNEIPITEADGFTRIEGLDVNTVGRVEVLKGPASSIYGAGTGGVLNFQIQRSPYGENSLEVASTGGSFGLARVASTYRIGTDRFNAAMTVGTQDYEGYRDYSNDYRRFITGSLQYFPSERQTITVLLNQTRQETQLPGSLTADQFSENPQQATQGNVNQQAARNQTWTRIGISQSYEISDQVTNISSVYSSFYELDHPLAFAYIRQPYQSYGGRTRLNYKPDMEAFPTTFTVGGEYVSAFVDSKRYQNRGGTTGDLILNQERDLRQYTVFYQSQTEVTPNTFFTLGLSLNKVRYDILDFLNEAQTGVKEFDAVLSPRVALSHVFSDQLALHGSVSVGFSPPTTSEINDGNGNVREEVQAERGTNYEVGARGVLLGQQLNYDVSVFSLQMRDQLIPQSVGQNRTIFNNAGETSLNGLEASLSYNLALAEGGVVESLRPFVSYAFSDFTFEDFRLLSPTGDITVDFSGNDVTGVSPHVLSAGIDLTSGVGAYLFVTYFFTGEAPITDDNSISNDAYGLVNMKLGFAAPLANAFSIDVHVGGDNLTDASYSSQVALNARAFGPPGTQPPFFNPAVGRSFYASLSARYRFNQ